MSFDSQHAELFWRLQKIYWHFELYFGFGLTQVDETRTTRMPAFWGYPPLESYWIPSEKKKKSYKFKEFAKIPNFEMNFTCDTPSEDGCKYEMDPVSINEYCWRYRVDTILSTDGQMDRRTRWNQYTPLQLCWAGGIINSVTTIQVVCPTQPIWCLLMHWRLLESVYQQALGIEPKSRNIPSSRSEELTKHFYKGQ